MSEPVNSRIRFRRYTALLQAAGVTSLGNSVGEPYLWSLARSPLYWDGHSTYTPIYTSSNVNNIAFNDTNAVSASVVTFDGAQWTILIARRTWEPAWAAPVATIAVFAALVLSVCILLIWVEHAQNTDLLLSVLPARVVRPRSRCSLTSASRAMFLQPSPANSG